MGTRKHVQREQEAHKGRVETIREDPPKSRKSENQAEYGGPALRDTEAREAMSRPCGAYLLFCPVMGCLASRCPESPQSISTQQIGVSLRGMSALTCCGQSDTIIRENKPGVFRTRIVPKNFPHSCTVHSFQLFCVEGDVFLSFFNVNLKWTVLREAQLGRCP